MALLIIIAAAIVFGGFFFGLTGFFSLIGVTYKSVGYLLLFIFYCLLVGVIFEVIEKIILFFTMGTNLHSKHKLVWLIIVKLVLTWVVIHIVNEFVMTVVLSSFAEFLTALLLTSVDIVLDDEKGIKDNN